MAEPAQARELAAEHAESGEAGRRRRKWARYWISDPLFGALYFAVHYGCRLLPIDWCSAIGGFLGVVGWRYRHRVRERVGRLYLLLSGGGASDGDLAVRRLCEHLGRVALEFSVLDKLWGAGRITAVGAEHLLAARHAGHAIIVMGVHVGNFELVGVTLIGLGFRGFKAFYQPPPSRFDHKLLVDARERSGKIPLSPGVAARAEAHRLLVEERGVLLVFADEARHGYVSAPLFGRQIPARCNLASIVRYAWASGAAVIPAYVERLDGARFRTTFLPPVELAPEGGDHPASLVENVHRLDRIITPIVLSHLDQWYMLVESRG